MADDPKKPSPEEIKEALELWKKLNKEKKTSLKYSLDLSEASAEEIRSRKEMLRLDQQHTASEAVLLARQGKKREAAKKLKKLNEEIELSIQRQQDALTAGEEIETRRLELVEQIKAAGDEVTDQMLRDLDELENKKGHLEDIDKKLGEQIKASKETSTELENQVGHLKNVSDGFDDMADIAKGVAFDIGEKMVGLVDVNKSWVGTYQDAIRGMTGAEDGISGIAEGFAEAFNMTNIAATVLTKYVESIGLMIGKLDSAATAFAGATGQGNKFRGALEDIYQSGNTMGLTMEDASKGLKGLLENQIGFTNMTTQSQNALAKQAGMLERVGVNAETSADLMNTFSKTMGTSAEQSMALTKQLAFMGTVVGISSERMIKDFQEANKTLAVYGKAGVKMFTNLAAGAKAAGVEMSSLLGLASKFDTFEDAADSVGKLNAILGANLSATEMLMMTEDKRIETLVQQVQMSGQTFAQMDRFKQKAIANAAGITDMAEANRIFGMSMSEYRGYTNQMTQNELTEQKFQEAVKATLPIKEKFYAMIMEFAPRVTPLLEGIHATLDYMLTGWEKLNSAFGGGFSTILAGAAGVFVTLKAFMGIMIPLAKLKAFWVTITELGFIAAVKERIATMAGLVPKQADATVTAEQAAANLANAEAQMASAQASGVQATAATASAGAMFKLGAAVLLVGAGIAIAAFGLGYLVNSFKGLGDAAWPAAVAVVGFTAAFVVLMLVLASMVTGPQAVVAAGAVSLLWAIGGAAMLMGGAMALAAYGMSLLVDSFSGFPVETISAISVGLVDIMTAMMNMGVLSAISGTALATSIGMIGLSLFALPLERLQSLAQVLDLSQTTVGISFVGQIAEDAERLRDALDTNLQATLDTLMLLNTSQTVESINNTLAETRVEDMINLSTTLNQTLDVSMSVGGREFTLAVRDAIRSKELDWDKGDMIDVRTKIAAGPFNA